MTIVEFLNARIDEEEADARAATPGRWFPEGKGVSDSDGIEFVEAPRRDVSHIARHDPARVLREVTMKRDLLALHKPGKADFYDVDQCDHCADQCHSSSGLSCEEPDARYPCDTVRTLATVHADHPDYQQEWKP